jgi:hypothetical protein
VFFAEPLLSNNHKVTCAIANWNLISLSLMFLWTRDCVLYYPQALPFNWDAKSKLRATSAVFCNYRNKLSCSSAHGCMTFAYGRGRANAC